MTTCIYNNYAIPMCYTADDRVSGEYNEQYMQMFMAANISMDTPLADPPEV